MVARFCRSYFSVVLVTLLVMGGNGWVQSTFASPPTIGKTTNLPHPFFFTENKGQWDSRVLYKCNARNGMTWFLERDGVTLLMMVQDKTKPPIVDPMDRDLPEMMRRHPVRYPMKSHALKFHFVQTTGSQAPTTNYQSPAIEASGELPWHNNYFLGNDSSKWAPDCRNFSSVIYRDVWDGIDVEWYEQNGKLEFDFVVQPGADPSQIQMNCEGLTGALSPSDKELKLPTSLGELRTALPSVYHITSGGYRSEVDAQFEITNKNVFGVMLPNGYQKEHTLRIDPLIYSTFLGGSLEDDGESITEGSNGGVIVTGATNSINFPTTVGAYDTSFHDNDVCFITRLNNVGSQIIYSTYLGGASMGRAIVYNNSDDGVIVTGDTFSDFPTTTNAYDTSFNGLWDCFITRLNSTGSQLIYSTFLGGSAEEIGKGIVSDGSGGAIVTGYTTSNNFPTTVGALQRAIHSTTDCFVTHLNNTGTRLLYSTFLGGSSDDSGMAITIDSVGAITVTGGTRSTDFPTTTSAFDTSFNGGYRDCFIACLNSTGTQLNYSTYLGGSGDEWGTGITGNGNGGVLVTGRTTSTNIPTTISAIDTSFNGIADCFVANLNYDGSRLLYCTYFGGSGDDWPNGIANDGSGGALITGSTTSTNFPTTTNAFHTTYYGGTLDCFVSRLNNTGTRLIYSTYLGGSLLDAGNAIITDENGGCIVISMSNSSDFPITTGAYDTIFNGGTYDCVITRLLLTPESISSVSEQIPTEYTLRQNYPNPFNSSTTISYSLPKPEIVEMKLFDLTGREITTLVNQRQYPGSYGVRFDGKGLSSGEYFYRINAGRFSKTQKMILIK